MESLKMQRDSSLKTILVATILCVVCSVLVSTTAIKLKPLHVLNAKRDIQKKLLLTADLIPHSQVSQEEQERIFNQFVEQKIIDLKSGREVSWEKEKTQSFDAVKAAKDPQLGEHIAPGKDLGKIRRRSKYGKVYLIKREGKLRQMVLPVYGKGLWSTLYGFISLGADLQTVQGLSFYAHGETPGLGGEVDNPNWKAQWKGKRALDDSFQIILDVLKGRVNPQNPQASSQVDGLTGATITSNGVEALIHYWLGQEGYGPYLATVKQNLREEKRP